jgi:hypothetical protein
MLVLQKHPFFLKHIFAKILPHFGNGYFNTKQKNGEKMDEITKDLLRQTRVDEF